MQNQLPATPDPIVVITDSTELYNSYPLVDTRWTLLAAEISAGRLRWIVPEVVVRETVRHQEKAWETAQRDSIPSVKNAAKVLKHFGITIAIPNETIEEAGVRATDYETYLRARIDELGGEVAALPKIEHDKLLAWDMRGRKPFATSGKGYRDALIWATVLECVATTHPDNYVIFVSSNTSDFAGKDGIHADLLEDTDVLRSAGDLRHSHGLTNAFPLAKDLRDAKSESGVRPNQETRNHGTAADITTEKPQNVDNKEADLDRPVEHPAEGPTSKLKDLLLVALDEQCSDLAGSDLEEHTQDGDVYGPDWLPSEFENPTVYNLDPDVDSVVWHLVEAFSDGTQLINVVAAASLTVDGYMYKSSFYGEEPRAEIHAMDADHNDHYAWVAAEGYARITFSILLSPERQAVNHTELISFETAANIFDLAEVIPTEDTSCLSPRTAINH